MKKKKHQPRVTARRRAEIIMKVRSGFITASEGAALLGVSRKTYYKWENRALEALMAGLEEKPPGRPETPEHEAKVKKMQHQIEKLKRDRELLEKQLALKDLVHQINLDEALQRSAPAAKRSSKKKR